MQNNSPIFFAFFGTDDFSVRVCNKLVSAGLTPTLIVTAPDRPAGRKQLLTPPPLKLWAMERNIPVIQPEKLNEENTAHIKKLAEELGTPNKTWDCFAVASYGRIIPQRVLDIPTHGNLNVHPSLLPLFRGASPIESAILADHKHTGVSIILMDAQMDHGPILMQRTHDISKWPSRLELEPILADIGGDMLVESMKGWIAQDGSITATEQDHSAATFTKKIEKVNAEIPFIQDGTSTGSEAYEIFRKIQAYAGWPQAHFYFDKKESESTRRMRVIVKAARFENNTLFIERVLPEGSHEMSWGEFARGFLK